jgi:hypothetical protein
LSHSSPLPLLSSPLLFSPLISYPLLSSSLLGSPILKSLLLEFLARSGRYWRSGYYFRKLTPGWTYLIWIPFFFFASLGSRVDSSFGFTVILYSSHLSWCGGPARIYLFGMLRKLLKRYKLQF